MFKKILYIFFIFVFVTSCADTFDSVKRGLTGTKANNKDEFLVKKKDPLILPPDFENLPTPDERIITEEENIFFEKALVDLNENDSDSSTSTNSEESILKKIQKK